MSLIKTKQGQNHGLSAYAQSAFGDFTGFIVAWMHWFGLCIGCVAVSIAFIEYFYALTKNLFGENVFLFPESAKVYYAIAIVCLMAYTNLVNRGTSLSILSYLSK